MSREKQLVYKPDYRDISADDETMDTKKEMAEVFIENLLFLKENYAHIDGELGYEIENLIAEYEELC